MNGGITTVEECHEHLKVVDGVMIGRQAYHQPWFLTELEAAFGNQQNAVTRHDIIDSMLPYIERELAAGAFLKHITRHMLGLFAGQPGARSWRRYLSENAHKRDVGPEIVVQALEKIPRAA